MLLEGNIPRKNILIGTYLPTYASVILAAAALFVWTNALPQMDPLAMNDLGMVSVMPPAVLLALGLLTVGFCLALLKTFLGAGSSASGVMVTWLIVLPALLGGIYLMHYFCWYLGILYKAHHAEFPWVLQRYIRDPRDRPRSTHADKLRRKRPVAGHLIPPPPPPPPTPPSAPSRIQLPGHLK